MGGDWGDRFYSPRKYGVSDLSLQNHWGMGACKGTEEVAEWCPGPRNKDVCAQKSQEEFEQFLDKLRPVRLWCETPECPLGKCAARLRSTECSICEWHSPHILSKNDDFTGQQDRMVRSAERTILVVSTLVGIKFWKRLSRASKLLTRSIRLMIWFLSFMDHDGDSGGNKAGKGCADYKKAKICKKNLFF